MSGKGAGLVQNGVSATRSLPGKPYGRGKMGLLVGQFFFAVTKKKKKKKKTNKKKTKKKNHHKKKKKKKKKNKKHP